MTGLDGPETGGLLDVATRFKPVDNAYELDPLVAADSLSTGNQVLCPIEDDTLDIAKV